MEFVGLFLSLLSLVFLWVTRAIDIVVVYVYVLNIESRGLSHGFSYLSFVVGWTCSCRFELLSLQALDGINGVGGMNALYTHVCMYLFFGRIGTSGIERTITNLRFQVYSTNGRNEQTKKDSRREKSDISRLCIDLIIDKEGKPTLVTIENRVPATNWERLKTKDTQAQITNWLTGHTKHDQKANMTDR